MLLPYFQLIEAQDDEGVTLVSGYLHWMKVYNWTDWDGDAMIWRSGFRYILQFVEEDGNPETKNYSLSLEVYSVKKLDIEANHLVSLFYREVADSETGKKPRNWTEPKYACCHKVKQGKTDLDDVMLEPYFFRMGSDPLLAHDPT